MHSNSRGELFNPGASRLKTTIITSVAGAIIKIASIFVKVIIAKVAKTKMGFLLFGTTDT